MVQNQDTMKGALFALVGGYALYWAFTQPCTIDLGQAAQLVNLPEQLTQFICVSSDFKLMIATIAGSAALFAGVSRFVKNV